MSTLIDDLSTTLRSLRRAPSFVLTVVATLALGIGLNAAIFTVVDCVLLRPLGYRDADRIVGLQTHFHDENRSIPRLGGDDYADLSRSVPGLEATADYMSFPDGFSLEGAAIYAPVAMVSPRFAEVMGVEPIAGRLFHSADQDGTDVLVSAAFARDHFASPAAALGHAITYSGAVYTIVGVLPEQFSFPSKSRLWFEMAATPRIHARSAYNQQAIGKRRAEVAPSQLAAQLAGFSAGLQKTYPEDRDTSIEAVPLADQVVGPIRSTLRLLMGAVALVLLIVCANVAHLQLARATRELRQTTLRAALGASRARLAGRALAEAALLATLGCAAALLVAEPALRLLVRLAPADIPRLAEVRLNLHVLLFCFAVSLAVMLVTALAPVWRSWRIDPASALRQDAARGSDSRQSLRLRNGLIVAEVALTLTLSVCATLLARQLLAENKQDLGFAPETLVTLDTHAILSTPWPRDKDETARRAAWDRIDRENLARLDAVLASVAATPGVESVAAMNGAPMSDGGSNVGYAVKGRQTFRPGVQHLLIADLKLVTAGFTNTLGVPLLRGRALAAQDRLDAAPVLVINRELARQVFPGEDPLGKQIMCGYDERSTEAWATIVGVVGDIRSDSPGAPPAPTLYLPLAQHPRAVPDVQVLVRTRAEAAAMVDTLRTRLASTHPEIAVKASTMRENIGATEQGERFRTLLLGSFAGVSILLAAVGMYGVTAYTVAQRRFEFALRMAVGATRGQVLALVLRRALAVAGIGIAAGLGLSVALARVLAAVVGALPAFDAPAYAVATLAVLAIAVAATLVPASRAANHDPMHVLRSE